MLKIKKIYQNASKDAAAKCKAAFQQENIFNYYDQINNFNSYYKYMEKGKRNSRKRWNNQSFQNFHNAVSFDITGAFQH